MCPLRKTATEEWHCSERTRIRSARLLVKNSALFAHARLEIAHPLGQDRHRSSAWVIEHNANLPPNVGGRMGDVLAMSAYKSRVFLIALTASIAACSGVDDGSGTTDTGNGRGS